MSREGRAGLGLSIVGIALALLPPGADHFGYRLDDRAFALLFIIGVVGLAVGVALVIHALVPMPPSKRPIPALATSPQPDTANLSFGGGLRRLLIPGERTRFGPTHRSVPVATPDTIAMSTDQNEALLVVWAGEQWANFHYKAWIFRLHVLVQNQTDEPIRLMSVNFQGPPQADTTPEIYAERERIKREVGVAPSVVPPHQTIDLWYIGEFAFDPDLGEPEYQILVKSSNGGHEYGFRRIGNPKRHLATS
jgi:hypothetical protein